MQKLVKVWNVFFAESAVVRPKKHGNLQPESIHWFNALTNLE